MIQFFASSTIIEKSRGAAQWQTITASIELPLCVHSSYIMQTNNFGRRSGSAMHLINSVRAVMHVRLNPLRSIHGGNKHLNYCAYAGRKLAVLSSCDIGLL